ncbi:tyrosine-protein phosphatase [Arthrobacter citreus]|nr:tyrosine-protein phosphatase [Arthrobacter citreus]
MKKSKLASYSLTFAISSSILSNTAHAQVMNTNGVKSQQVQTSVINQQNQLIAKVERTQEGKLKFSWDGSNKKDKVRIFWSTSPEKIGKLLVKVNTGTSITVDDPSPKARPYFHIIGENGSSTIVAERKVFLQGTFNFRDLGGYETVDRRTVQWGKLYRSDALVGLTKNDISYIQNSGLKTILDYRGEDEIAKSPDPVIKGVTNINDPVIKSGSTTLDIFNLDMEGLDKTFKQMQREMVEDPDVEAYRTLFQLLLKSKNDAVLQHCTAGKDRTGVGSALVLLSLGVPENTVLDDYLLSNNPVYIQKQLDAMAPLLKTDEQRQVVTAIMGVKKEWLQASLDQIKEHYGSYDNYFKKVIGLTAKDREKLKEMYLN